MLAADSAKSAETPVEQPVGLVDALGHRHGDNRAISGHLDDRDAERGVDPCVGAGENGRIRLAAASGSLSRGESLTRSAATSGRRPGRRGAAAR